MRAMPFRTAADSSVIFSDPVLRFRDTVIEPGQGAPSWDYLTPLQIEGTVTVDEVAVLQSTGLDSLDGVEAALQVDCAATGFRRLSTVPLVSGAQTTHLSVSIDGHLVAAELEVRYELLLNAPDRPPRDNAAAHRRGSRLHTGPRPFRYRLEGEGSGFPTEAFEFARTGFPENAVWWLNFSADNLDEPFLSAVRLFVNTAHEAATELLSGNNRTLQSVLQYNLLEQMLLTVADHWDDDQPRAFIEGSVGAVLSDLTHLHLDMDLPSAVAAIKGNRTRVLATLQATMGFLQGGRS